MAAGAASFPAAAPLPRANLLEAPELGAARAQVLDRGRKKADAPQRPGAIALANKLARIAWAVLAKGRNFECAVLVILLVNKQLDLFEREAQQAMALAPYDGEILAGLGSLIATSGQWPRGVALVTKANALNADSALGWYQVTMYYDCYLKGDYDRALEFRRLHPDQKAIYTYIEYIPVYGQLGRKQDALENWQKLLGEDPSCTAASFESWYHRLNMRDEDIAKMMDGVYKSGVLGPVAKPGQ